MRSKAITAVIIVLLLVVYYYQYPRKKEAIQPQNITAETKICLDGEACLQRAELSVSFAPFPTLLEEEIAVTLFLAEGWELKRGWVEGVNMYMGKTPLLIQENVEFDKNSKGIFFLGSCSEPDMHWRLITVWQQTQTGKSVTAFYDFYTHR